MVLADGPYPTSWTRGSATAVVPSSWMPPCSEVSRSGARWLTAGRNPVAQRIVSAGQSAPSGSLALLLAQGQPGDTDHAGRREAAAHPFLDQCDGRPADLGGEVVGPPDRLAAGHPERARGHGCDLGQELHRRGAAADDHDALAAQRLRSGVLVGV
jgi:hypothetical protein